MKTRIGLEKTSIIPQGKNDMSVYNDNIKNQEEIKRRKMELINGTKNLLKGIYNNTTSSCYQEIYK